MGSISMDTAGRWVVRRVAPRPTATADRVLQTAFAELAALEQALATSGSAPDDTEQPDEPTRHVTRLRRQLGELGALIADAEHHAYHDTLTGLPNRALLLDRLRQAAAQSVRQGKLVAVLLLDLDGFKSINDRLGHEAGDQVLEHVAGMVQGCIREGDTACRYGGDEFVIMLPEVADLEAATAVADKIQARLASPVLCGEHLVSVSASIGIALYPADGGDLAGLIRAADLAMYRAKASRCGTRVNERHAATAGTRRGQAGLSRRGNL